MGYVYERMISFESLYRAHMRARKGHRHKPEIIRYEARLSENLLLLQSKLMDLSKLKIQYFHFKVYEPKTRDIAATQYETRVMLHALCDEVISPRLSEVLYEQNMACQKSKGNHKALKLLTRYCYELTKEVGNDFYFMKVDVRKYFQSIDHEILKHILRRVFDDAQILALCNLIIESTSGGKGLPLGNQSSQQFGILYTHTVDHLILKELGMGHFVHYMDDYCVLHPDREKLVECLKLMRERFKRLNLELNENKTEIVKASRGITFLGFRFIVSKNNKIIRRLKKESKRRLKKKVKKLKGDHYDGVIDFDSVSQSIMSHHGHLIHGHTWHLQKKMLFSVCYKKNWG